jgi:hypothetical protein
MVTGTPLAATTSMVPAPTPAPVDRCEVALRARLDWFDAIGSERFGINHQLYLEPGNGRWLYRDWRGFPVTVSRSVDEASEGRPLTGRACPPSRRGSTSTASTGRCWSLFQMIARMGGAGGLW